MEYYSGSKENNSTQSIRSSIVGEVAKIDHILHFLKYVEQKNLYGNLFAQYSQKYAISFQKNIQCLKVDPFNYNFWEHSIQTKYNWVDDFINDDNTSILGVDTQNNEVQILNYQDKSKSFIVSSNTQNAQFPMTSRSLHEKNQKLTLLFKKHRFLYKIENQLCEININEATRLILSVEDQNKEELRRIAIMKKNQQGKYVYLDGKYDDRNFKYPVRLQPGTYIIFCTGLSKQFSIVSSKEIDIKSETVTNIQIYNLLIGAFEQGYQSHNRKDVEFIRVNYMDVGIVIEVYINVYDYVVQLIDQQKRSQDKTPIFPQLYKPDFLLLGKLRPKQKIILFNLLTKKPATLYLPEKKILLLDKEIQCLSIHNSFK